MGESTEPARREPDAARVSTPSAPPSADAAAQDKPRILVIDDSRVIRRAISKILNPECLITEAEDGESGWNALLADESIQVIISDVEMPALDGYALICRVRAIDNERVRAVPVIIITGAQDEVTRERAFACGATDFITKPIDGVQLLARARAHARLDQTTRKLAETAKTLEDQSAIDPLTELHSRRYFLQRAEQDVAYAKRHGQALTLVRIDIDNFRTLYKQHGDDWCDQMLVWIARLLRAGTRIEDTAARISGGSFAVLAPATDREAVTIVAERLRVAVAEKPFTHEGPAVALTISLGIGTIGPDGDTVEALLAHAEERLTLAKADGGNRLGVSYEEEVAPPEQPTMEQPDIETALTMTANGEGGKLTPYLPDLLARMLPLLELCAKSMDTDLGAVLKSLKQKLAALK